MNKSNRKSYLIILLSHTQNQLHHHKELSIKTVRTQRKLYSMNILRTREKGFFRMMRTSALFGAKNFGFFEIYGVSSRIREVEPVRTFCGQGRRGSIFCDFVRMSFMDAP